MRSRRLPLPFALLVASLAPLGCGAPAAQTGGALHYTEDAKRAYDEAMVAFDDKDWDTAKALFKEVKRKYGYSRYARLAELRIADADWQAEKTAEAIQEYRSFVHDHRTDEEVPYARFRIVKGLYGQISDTLLLPPQEERDQATTGEAYKELRSFLHDYPRSKYTPDAEYMLTIVTGRLVRHELYVARFYLRRDNYGAAVARAQYALRNFEGSGLEPEAMVLLGETYLKMHQVADAKQTFAQVLTKYPTSAFTATAKNFLEEIAAQGK